MHQALLQGEDGCLSTIAHMELAENVAHMNFDRFFADDEAFGDYRIIVAFGDEAQDFKLTVAQFQEQVGGIALCTAYAAYFFDDTSGDARMQHAFTTGGMADSFHEFSRPNVLKLIGEGSRS